MIIRASNFLKPSRCKTQADAKWSLRHRKRHGEPRTIQEGIAPLPTVEIADCAFEASLRQPEFRDVDVVDRDARSGGEDDALHDAVPVPMVFPAMAGLFNKWHCWQRSCDVVAFVLVRRIEKRWRVFD